MKIVIASGNAHKIKEYESILKKYIPDIEAVSLKDINFNEDIVEDGNTFEENAMIKAKTIAKLGYIGVGDDSGLCVDALGGAPGIFSARYSGEHGNDKENIKLLLKNLENQDNRNAHFVCAIAVAFPDGRNFCVRGEAYGKILREEKGFNGFGYDPVFYYEPLKKSFAELDENEKNSVSHRANASIKFAQELKKYI